MPNYKPLESRFWSYVSKGDSCWLWIGARTVTGYGAIGAERPSRKTLKAHRVSYELHLGKIPDGLLVCHRCDNPLCVNPDHLFLGTSLDNNRDREAKGRGNQAKGQSQAHAKLTEDDVKYIRASRLTTYALAKQYGMHYTTIMDARKGTTWKHVKATQSS